MISIEGEGMSNATDLRLKRVKRIAGWSTFILLIVTQWEVRPWVLFAEMFFIAFTIWQLLSCYFEFRLHRFVILLGGTMNFIALTANNGRMPVLGKIETARWWQPLTEESRVKFLCDVLWATCSIGDMVILTGILIGLGLALYKHLTASTPVVTQLEI